MDVKLVAKRCVVAGLRNLHGKKKGASRVVCCPQRSLRARGPCFVCSWAAAQDYGCLQAQGREEGRGRQEGRQGETESEEQVQNQGSYVWSLGFPDPEARAKLEPRAEIALPAIGVEPGASCAGTPPGPAGWHLL